MIAVLARKNPVLVPLSAFLIAYIRTGASLVATKTQIPPEFVSIIQGIIIVLVAAEISCPAGRRNSSSARRRRV